MKTVAAEEEALTKSKLGLSDYALENDDKIGIIDNYRGDEQYHVIISAENQIVGMDSAKRLSAQFFSYHEISDFVGKNGDAEKIKRKIKEKFVIYTGNDAGNDDNDECFNEVEQVDNQIIHLAKYILENSHKSVHDGNKQKLISAYGGGRQTSPDALAQISYDSNAGGYGTNDHLMHIFIKAMDESDRVSHISQQGISDFGEYYINENADDKAGKSVNKIIQALGDLTDEQKNNLFYDIRDLSISGETDELGIGRSLNARMKVYNYFDEQSKVEDVNKILGLYSDTDKALNKLEIVTIYLTLSSVAQKASKLVGAKKTLDQMSLDTLNSPLQIQDGIQNIEGKTAKVEGRVKREGVAKTVKATDKKARKRLTDLMKGTTQEALKIETFIDTGDGLSEAGADDDYQIGAESVIEVDNDAVGGGNSLLVPKAQALRTTLKEKTVPGVGRASSIGGKASGGYAAAGGGHAASADSSDSDSDSLSGSRYGKVGGATSFSQRSPAADRGDRAITPQGSPRRPGGESASSPATRGVEFI